MEESFSVQITEEMMDNFLSITSDKNPLHCDETFAIDKGFSSRVVYGMLTASFLSTLAGMYLPGKNSLIYSVDVNFAQPVFIGDHLRIKGVVFELDVRFRCFRMKVSITNQDGKKVVRGSMKVGVRE